ncbi:2-C-methyl-D-erythritol 4-phosphate cytidylyltransferase [candidate division CSSED10-310 bacterium]|uniref:2-C-methyl-D-erythritol 4-phosphate cytidylyltransferase n=1 Tax=candidate division CSSED10-310 bacterium TaxID=2855610 RepID=A0ABV6Z118_UNCC1
MKTNSQSRTAIIAAGGTGSRMGSSMPKQMLLLEGLPILCHVLQRFQEAEEIDALVLVLEASLKEQAVEYGFTSSNYSKLVSLVPGGPTRTESVWCGLNVLSSAEIVLIHDGVRPLVSKTLIHNAVEAAQKYGAAVPALDCTDTLKRITAQGTIAETVDRHVYRLIQTPQAFRYDVVRDIYSQCMQRGITGTDDASLAEKCGHQVHIFQGEPGNIKITFPQDLKLAQFYLSQKI